MSRHLILRAAPSIKSQAVAWIGVLLATACASPAPLGERWMQLRTEQPQVHLREAARMLGAAEAQLLQSEVGVQAIRLKEGGQNYHAIFDRLPALGNIRTITRNDSVILARTGSVVPARMDADGRVIPGTGFADGPIDLRFSMAQWGSAFAVVRQERDGKTSRSLQFFDRHGEAVHKIYLDNAEHVADFDILVSDFRMAEQSAPLILEPKAQTGRALNASPSAADIAELRQSWNELTDVHQFPRLLRELKLSREQALTLIGSSSAWRVQPQALQEMIEASRGRGQPIMAFVSSSGITQIYSGPIEESARKSDWYTISAAGFSLDVRVPALDHGWVVRRPTSHGMVTSIEFYDRDGNMLVNFFSRRERGREESALWRAIVEALPRS